MKKSKVHLFVTGGWDSTFMLCKMSRRNIIIQPVYVFNPKRKSRNRELESVRRIIRAVLRHPGTKAKIEHLKVINLSNIRVDQDIIAARHRLMKKVGPLGYQYDYLATIAKYVGMVGLGIEKGLDGGDIGANANLRSIAKLRLGRFGWVVDDSELNPDVNLLFGYIFFPILDYTELDMEKWAKKNGYMSIMKMIWFCHSPIHGLPCGLCRPCEEKVESKMEYLMPPEAMERLEKAKKWSFLGEKLSRSIKNSLIFFLSDEPNEHKKYKICYNIEEPERQSLKESLRGKSGQHRAR